MTECQIADLKLENASLKTDLGRLREENKENKWYKWFYGIWGFVFGLVLIYTCVVINQERENYHKLQKSAITQGFAQYNPTNGVWEWKK